MGAEAEKIDDLNVEAIVWKLFEQTGEIRYYMFFNALQQNKILEQTNPELFVENNGMSRGR